MLQIALAPAAVASVVPAAYADAEAPGSNSVPFSLQLCGPQGIRYQQLYDGSEVGAGNISEVRFRADGGPGAAWQPVIVTGVTVRLAARQLAPADFGMNMDASLGGAAEVVYSGNLILAAGNSAALPRPFDLTIPLDRPFAFEPAGGTNLLLEIRIATCAALSRGLDFASDAAVSRAFAPDPNAVVATSHTEGAGLVTQFVMADGAACTPGPSTLCLDGAPGDGRFRVEVDYQTAQGGGLAGAARAMPLASLGVNRGGLFWFFSADNPELLVKVLDGCALNDHYWVFWSAGTNVGVTVTVTDLVSGQTWQSRNPDLRAAPPVQDTGALPCR